MGDKVRGSTVEEKDRVFSSNHYPLVKHERYNPMIIMLTHLVSQVKLSIPVGSSFPASISHIRLVPTITPR